MAMWWLSTKKSLEGQNEADENQVVTYIYFPLCHITAATDNHNNKRPGRPHAGSELPDARFHILNGLKQLVYLQQVMLLPTTSNRHSSSAEMPANAQM